MVRRGGAAAFIIAIRLGSDPRVLIKTIPQSARLGFIYVDLGWGTSKGIINKHHLPPLLGKGEGASAPSQPLPPT